MVTMRRDVAAAANNSIFDRWDRDTELTDYDIFMRNRAISEASGYGVDTVVTASDDVSARKASRYHKEKVKEPKSVVEYDSYDDYMRAQINRSGVDGKVLSKEEFYHAKYCAAEGVTAARRGKGRMSKASKIFTAVYVLMVVVAASIMVIVNASAGGDRVSANADADSGAIQALTITESYDIEGNAFDDLLDKLSNK